MKASICDLNDVERYLGNSPPADITDLEPYLEEAVDYVVRVTKRNFADAGQVVTETFYDVRENSRLRLKDLAPTNVSVVVTSVANNLYLPGLPPWTLTENSDFVQEEDGWIRITRSLFVRLQGLTSGYARRTPQTWDEVAVTYTTSGLVPATAKEATALIAAAFYKQGPYDASSFQSERLGDYSYMRAPHIPASAVIPTKARYLLRLLRGTYSRST